MKRIDTLRLFQYEVPVYSDPSLEDDVDAPHAVIDWNPRPHIRVIPDLHPSQYGTVLLHEMIHFLDWVLGLDLTEEQTRALEVGVPAILLQNTSLRKKVLRKGLRSE